MVRMPSDGPSPVYTPHESAVIFTTPDVNPYRPSICRFRPTDSNLLPSFVQSGEQATPGIAPFLIRSASRRVVFPFSQSVSVPSINKVVHTYCLTIAEIDIRLFITIEPVRELSREHSFFLTLKAGALERPISQPATLRLTVDPRTLEFVVFAYPPRACLPQGCLYSLRVWLRSGEIDHRLFSEDALWIGKDPDFSSVEDAAFARLRNVTTQMLLYKIAVGSALMDFTIRWRKIFDRMYSLSLEYDGCGVGRILLSDFIIGLDCPPEDLAFVIYTIPVTSTPRGATHRIRLWIRVPAQAVSMSPPTVRFIYQRIWSTDSFKVGNCLDFTALGPKLIVGVPDGDGPRTLHSTSEQLYHREGGLADIKQPTYGEPSDIRKEMF